MNYIKELRAFRDWQLVNPLPTSAIAMWHSLMMLNNMTGWKEWFNGPYATLESLTGLSKQGIIDARKTLKEYGLIDFKNGTKGKAPTYKINSFVDGLVNQLDDELVKESTKQQVKSLGESLGECEQKQEYAQSLGVSSDDSLNIPKHKLNINNKHDDDHDKRQSAFDFYQNNFGMINSFLADSISNWIDDIGEDLVIEAMKRTLLQNSKSFKYTEKILMNWTSRNVKSMDDVKALDVEFENRQQKGSKVVRFKNTKHEVVPDWHKQDDPSVNQDDWERQKRILEERIKNL